MNEAGVCLRCLRVLSANRCPGCGDDKTTEFQVDQRMLRLLNVVGRGASGIVFRAEIVTSGEERAVKLLAPRVDLEDETARKLFYREASAATKVRHANLVTFHAFQECRFGRLFLEFEYIRGRTLQEVLEQGPLPTVRAVRLAIQALHAVAALHDAKVIHRDLKPGNMMLVAGADDVLKIIDLGFAKSTDDASDLSLGWVMGTPSYMAPERFHGPATFASDVYSIGATLFHMVYGIAPDPHLDEIPEHTPEGTSVATVLRGHIRRSLNHDPAHRFQSARDFAGALNDVAAHGETSCDEPQHDTSSTPIRMTQERDAHHRSLRMTRPARPPIALSWTLFHPVLVGGDSFSAVPADEATAIHCYPVGAGCAQRTIELTCDSVTEFALTRRRTYKSILDGPGDGPIAAAVDGIRSVTRWTLPPELLTAAEAKPYVLSVVRLRNEHEHTRSEALLKLLACPSILVDAERMSESEEDETVTLSGSVESRYLSGAGVVGDFAPFVMGNVLHGFAAWSGVAFATDRNAVASSILRFENELQAVWWLLEVLRYVPASKAVSHFVRDNVRPLVDRLVSPGLRDSTWLTLAKEAIVSTSRIRQQWEVVTGRLANFTL